MGKTGKKVRVTSKATGVSNDTNDAVPAVVQCNLSDDNDASTVWTMKGKLASDVPGVDQCDMINGCDANGVSKVSGDAAVDVPEVGQDNLDGGSDANIICSANGKTASDVPMVGQSNLTSSPAKMKRSISEFFVMVADPQECIRLSHEGAAIEKVALAHDVSRQVNDAVEAYRRAVAKFYEAADVCPEGHPDGQMLKQHVRELLWRVEYLEGLDDDHTMMPPEKHIHVVQLTLGSPQFMSEVSDAVPWYSCDEAKVMGAAAAMGVATGLLMLGPITGVAFGLVTAVATTCEDETGAVARKAGDVGVQIFNKANKLNKEHKISHHVATIGRNALEKTASQTFDMVKQLVSFTSAKLA